MRGVEALRVALDALLANRLRSLLTMIGIVVGVAAVVVVVSIGAGARERIESQVEGLGSNLVLVVPGEVGGPGAGAPTLSRMRLSDAEVLQRVVGEADAVTARLTSGERVSAGSTATFTTVHGTDEDVPAVFDRPLADGDYLTATDVDTRRRVAVLGWRTAAELFGDADPIGRQIGVGGTRFRVIGVLAERGESFGVSQDEEVHVPVTVAQRLFGTDRVDGFAVRAPDSQAVPALSRDLEAAMEAEHPEQAFSAITQTQILGVIGEILGLLTAVLAAIAGISLLVGGVGVSNIMLVSVRERTREIGLRKALGARQRDVLTQFLLEAVLLTTAGGLLGIAAGLAASLLLDRFSPLPAAVEWWSPVLAFAVSAAVGVCFGVLPARRAGRLEPVVALRSD